MTTFTLGLGGQAPAGWSVCPTADWRAGMHFDFTPRSEVDQRFTPRITLSVLDTFDPGISLEALARQRLNSKYAAATSVHLRRGEFICRSNPEIYGQEIRLEVEISPGEHVAVIHSEILIALTRYSNQVLTFLLTAPEAIFEKCAQDFAVLVNSIDVQESG